jgi:hypothetical protein
MATRPILNGLPYAIPTLLSDASVTRYEQRHLTDGVTIAHYTSRLPTAPAAQRASLRATCARLALKQDISVIEMIRVTSRSIFHCSFLYFFVLSSFSTFEKIDF